MKKIFFILIPFLFLSCSNNVLSGKQVFLVDNKASKPVTVSITGEDSIKLNPGSKTTVYAYADSNFTCDSYLRCDITFNSATLGYDITDAVGKTVTAYNNSTKDIMLCERDGYIGSYQEIEAAAASQGKSISSVAIQKKIDAGSSTTFVVFSNNPRYYAYFKDNNMAADLSLLSFN